MILVIQLGILCQWPGRRVESPGLPPRLPPGFASWFCLLVLSPALVLLLLRSLWVVVCLCCRLCFRFAVACLLVCCVFVVVSGRVCFGVGVRGRVGAAPFPSSSLPPSLPPPFLASSVALSRGCRVVVSSVVLCARGRSSRMKQSVTLSYCASFHFATGLHPRKFGAAIGLLDVYPIVIDVPLRRA